MKISAIKLQEERDGIQKFEVSLLKDLVLLAGSNGAGKTRLLKAIQKNVESLQNDAREFNEKLKIEVCKDGRDEMLTVENACDVTAINYSHYDAKLQLPNDFSPYVIHKAKEILKQCDYEETALNSLLFIEDMARGYSEEFQDGECFLKFQKRALEDFEIQINYDKDRKKLQVFGQDIEKAELSPGQQYLLRMAVACFQNENKDNLIFFMDEPELHLHPKALIRLLKNIRQRFSTSQIWVATHSLALISYFAVTEEKATILYLQNGNVQNFRSDSSGLLNGLIGSDENQFAIQQLIATPDAYASNKFAFECFDSPAVLAGKDGSDKQVAMVRTILHSGDVVVDYGAGKGRFFEELALSDGRTEDGRRAAEAIIYYAYNKKELERLEDAEECKAVMEEYGSTANNYFNDLGMLQKAVGGEAKYVCLINVLHEIPPSEWEGVFQDVKILLGAEGRLVIVEREELMTGEAPYTQGFLMVTQNAVNELFGKEQVQKEVHPDKQCLVKYTIELGKSELGNTISAVELIRSDALEIIRQIKETPVPENRKSRFETGIKLAFWTHQYANASLVLEDIGKDK